MFGLTVLQRGVDVALLVGAMPRKPGMERKDLLQANAKIFESMGKTINEVASKNIKVIIQKFTLRLLTLL